MTVHTKQWRVFIIMIILLFCVFSCSKNTLFRDIKSQKYYASLVNEIIIPGTELPLNESAFQSACWAMEITQYRGDYMLQRMKDIYKILPQYELSTHRSFWEAVNALYPDAFELEAYEYLLQCDQPKLFAMCAYYLLQNANTAELSKSVRSILSQHFTPSQQLNDPILFMLQYALEDTIQIPPIGDLLEHHYNSYPMIYVLLRRNRDYPGLAIIKNENGEWIKDGKQVLHTSILGRSLSNLPGTITNGNTPQGIYTISGIDSSDNVFIGPNKTIITSMPFEISRELFFHGSQEGSWSIRDYSDMLPKTWGTYPGIYEAFYAGLAGRSEIIIHGSTIWPELYKNKPYYPLTPSLGCMTHYEKWDDKGRLIESDQQKLVKALLSCSTQEGFLIVVEINDEQRAVRYNDIKNLLQ